MKTWKRICIEDYTVRDDVGTVFALTRGQEYLTSADRDGTVTVFSSYWVNVPSTLFAGSKQFT